MHQAPNVIAGSLWNKKKLGRRAAVLLFFCFFLVSPVRFLSVPVLATNGDTLSVCPSKLSVSKSIHVEALSGHSAEVHPPRPRHRTGFVVFLVNNIFIFQ
jgi:hypothetical protein